MTRARLVMVVSTSALLLGCIAADDPLPRQDLDASVSGAPDASAARDTSSSRDAEVEPDAGDPVVCDAPRTACGVECADLQIDPTNCGGCGRTCVIPSARAACVSGACAVGACDEGFYDTNGALADGCEATSSCQDGVSCLTACGSEGVSRCDGTDEVCDTLAETCNGVDDDCDGTCDTGLAGCHKGIHRGSGSGHVYSDQLSLVQTAPYTVEAQNYFFIKAVDPGTGDYLPVFQCRKGNGLRFITTSTNCEQQGAPERELGFWATRQTCGALPLYRLFKDGNHFFTRSEGERNNARDNLGYTEQGIAGWVFDAP